MTQHDLTRRRLMRLLTTATVGGIAGCAGFDEQETGTMSPQSTTTDTPTPTTITAPPPDDTTTTERSKPGYKEYHWHGRLFFEIDGELVDFSQPKYHLKNLEQDRPETVYFHFHDDPATHGPNEWSNEKKTVSFARALNLLPTIEYERQGDADVITYDGQTYRGSASGTSIDIYRGTERITPPQHTVQHNDNFWVRIQASRPTTSGTRSGTFIVDINNQRLSWNGESRVGTDRFSVRGDGPHHTWANNGQPVTLAEALNTLPDITYRRSGGTSEITYTADTAFGGTYRGTNDATTILTRQRWNDVTPQSYELQDGDIIWVYVHTSQAPDNEH